MFKFLTYFWIILITIVILAFAISISLFLFIGVGIIILLTVPYVLYIKWKANKELEKYNDYIDVECEDDSKKSLKDRF